MTELSPLGLPIIPEPFFFNSALRGLPLFFLFSVFLATCKALASSVVRGGGVSSVVVVFSVMIIASLGSPY